MAGEFLRSHGIDIDAEMSKIQNAVPAIVSEKESDMLAESSESKSVPCFINVSLPQTPQGTRWDVSISNGKISKISSHDGNASGQPTSNEDPKHIDAHGALLAPSLCHPHIHIDKAFLLSHPKYVRDLQIQRGDFAEALELTGKAKALFETQDLLERGQRVIDESVAAGVTHMRAFVEVDAGVGMKCLDAGLELKRKAEAKGRCKVQICAFAQLPLYSSSPADDDGSVIRGLMEQAAEREGVDVLGSTPYVETNRIRMEWNVKWMIELCLRTGKHLDFHLDYNLDTEEEPMVWHVIRTLKDKKWNTNSKTKAYQQTVVLGHCTRLTLCSPIEWHKLRDEVGDLPISFVGLPTSDLFMMRTAERVRGTLDVPSLIKDYGLNACLGINNIGNAFTPQGSCDPLTLACNGVAMYSAGTNADAELLYLCVSTRAKQAIGFGSSDDDTNNAVLTLSEGQRADLVLFGAEKEDWRTRKTVPEAVYLYDHCHGRRSVLDGSLTANR